MYFLNSFRLLCQAEFRPGVGIQVGLTRKLI